MAGCEKTFGAFACCSTCQKHDHHISHHQEDPVSAFHTPNPSPSTQAQKAKKDSDDQKPMSEAQKSELDTNDRFSDYVNRSNMKIRIITIDVDQKPMSGAQKSEVDTNDNFAEYICRSKTKFRSSMNVGRRNRSGSMF